MISREEIREVQTKWKEGIIKIGELYREGGNYREYAYNFLRDLYAFDRDIVLFKPTVASKKAFRQTIDEALSYFIGGIFKEDKGFALQNIYNIQFEIAGELYFEDIAISQGKYCFFLKETKEVNEVHFTFVYRKFENNEVKIVAHHSSLPYTPK